MRRLCGISWCLRRSSVSLCLRELSEMIDRARIACQLSERKKAIYGHRCFKSASFRDTLNARDPDDAPRALRAARGRPGMRDVVQRRNGTARSPAHVPKPAQVAALLCDRPALLPGPLAVCAVLLAAVLVLPALRRLEQRQHVPLVVQRMDLQPAGVPRLRDLHWWRRRRHRIATAAAATSHLCAVVQPLDVPEPSVLVLRDLRRRRRLAAAHAGRLAAHDLVAPSAAHVRKPGLLGM